MDFDIEKRVVSVAEEILSVEKGVDVLNASFANDLYLGSLERMTLFIALEDEFDRTIPQEEVSDLDSVAEIIAFIREKLAREVA